MASLTDTMSAPAVLHAVADYFEADPARWGREWYLAPDGCRCTLGAIAYVIDPDNPAADPAFLGTSEEPDYKARALAAHTIRLLESYLLTEVGFTRPVIEPSGDPDEVFEDGPFVGAWNDAPGRTVHEVIGTLRGAAVWAEARS